MKTEFKISHIAAETEEESCEYSNSGDHDMNETFDDL